MSTRVLVIGLDAAERSIVLDLVDQGRMPNLRSLLDRGAHNALDAPPHVFVGATWPTLYTGAGPGFHGRWAPQAMRRDSYETEWRGARTAIEPFWGALAERGLRIAAIDVPLAPLVPRANVAQLAEWATHDNVGPMSSWAGAGPDPFAGLEALAPDTCDSYRRHGRLDDLRRHLLGNIEHKTALAETLIRDSDWDLALVVYGESHCIGHQAWHLHDRSYTQANLYELPADDVAGNPIVDVYEALDVAVGRLVAALDAETTVAVVLSHGMGPHYDGTHLLGEILGRIETARAGAPNPVVRLREAAIRRVRRRGQSGARGDHPHVDGEFGRALDGSRRLLRMPNAAPVGCVRLNVVGREPRGRVRAGTEFEELGALLERELLAIVDPVDGEPLVTKVTPVREAHDGPFAAEFGDVFVEWRRDRPIVAATSPAIGLVEGSYGGLRSGDHYPGGLLIAAGPTVEPGGFPVPLPGEALVPLVCGWLGVDAPEHEGARHRG